MLNFEDADPNAGPGLAGAIKGKNVPGQPWMGSAAVGTTQIYNRRALAKSSKFKQKSVVYYSCQEMLQRDMAGTLAKGDLANIRADCSSAKTIAFILHGKPGETEHGFATSGAQLCSWKDLGKLALLVLPDGGSYNIALIMCYGGRSENARLDHRGAIPDTDLKTSFAYKFFRSICVSRHVRMSARTGAVSNDSSVNHTVESEEQVFLLLDRQEAMAKRTLKKSTMDIRKAALLSSKGVSEAQFGAILDAFVLNNAKVPVGEVETFAKKYIIYSSRVNYYLQSFYNTNDLNPLTKFGKLIYTYDGHDLEITARYDTGNGDNYQLYKGRLL
jgi:hypothetical protein